MHSNTYAEWLITLLISCFMIFLFTLFLYLHRQERTRILNGFILNAFLGALALFTICLSGATNNHYIFILTTIPFIAFLIISTFGLFALIIGLFLNAHILMKKEGRRFSNCLTLALGIITLVSLIVLIINPGRFIPEEIVSIYMAMTIIFVYFVLDGTSFLTAYLLYRFNRPKLNQNFIIVLGSGLINDQVTPLLASRIEKAIGFYKKQSSVMTPPKLIFSGGQGHDENLSEAKAMQNFVLEKGIPLEDTIIEDRSINTYQNMLFSKKIIEEIKGENYTSIFSSNEYHIFRSGMLARKAGLKSQGVGAKTAFYFWPNAMIREYIAILVMQRKRHIMVTSTILGLSILLTSVKLIFSFF